MSSCQSISGGCDKCPGFLGPNVRCVYDILFYFVEMLKDIRLVPNDKIEEAIDYHWYYSWDLEKEEWNDDLP